jgi:hypothetical protein
MTHKEAFQKITGFINEAILVNLKMNEREMAYQKHLLLSFANSLENKAPDYKKNIEILLSMIERTVEINREFKEYQQADQMSLIYELARSLSNISKDDNEIDLTLLN